MKKYQIKVTQQLTGYYEGIWDTPNEAYIEAIEYVIKNLLQ